MEDKKITIYDIAAEVGVSASMVSRVLSGKGSVSDKTRKKIQDTIDKYHFRPNAIARGLQKSRTRIIGFMIPHIGNEYFSNLYYEFEKYASANGYMTILYNGKNDPETESRILNVFDEVRVEAAVIMGGNVDAINIDPGYASAIGGLNRRVPCILCSEQADKFGCTGVHMDTKKAARLLVEHVKEKGYPTLGILGGAYDRFPTKLLRDHIQQYAKECGIEVRPEWIHGISYDEKDGAEAMQKLLEQKELPRAVCCINDYVAYGAMVVAEDAGLKIPEDIAFTGNDDLHIASMLRPRLTTVAADFEQMGRMIFDQIIAHQNSSEIKNYLIDPILVERDST